MNLSMSSGNFEKYIPGIECAKQIALDLKNAGFRALIVGGAVRDILQGKTPQDIDMVTTAKPDELAEVFDDIRFAGISFGVSLVRIGDVEIELASARSERCYLDGRHPESVSYTDDFSLDALRRDFTVNAMMLDPLTGELLDFVGGQEDLRRGILRTVGDAKERFSEDYLRMLRAVRFAANCGFDMENSCLAAIKKLAPLTAEISGERIRQELGRILCGKAPERAVRLLDECGILQYILPEVAALHGVEQPEQFHPEGDVFEHTMLMLRHMAMPDGLLPWCVLFHDIGKKAASFRDDSGRIRFFNHESIGADMAEQICRRLHFSVNDTRKCVQAVRNHMRFAQVTDMRQGKLRKLLADDNFSLELELHRLDCISCHGLMTGFLFLLDKLVEFSGEVRLPEPLIKGRDLVAAGFKPSPEFSGVLEAVFERQLADEFAGKAEALAAAKELLS